MGLLDKWHTKQLVDAIVSKKAEAEQHCRENTRYLFGPLWQEEDKKAFFLSPWIRKCIFAKDAPYSKLTAACLENEPDSVLAVGILNKIYGIAPHKGQLIYVAANKLYQESPGNEPIKVSGIGELSLFG